eukprot:jgi/Undpi1/8727/HiC_scaffold_25.g11191.m1
MSQLRAELLKMSFPRLEDEAEQDFGEATWENAVDMVIAYVGHGYDLKRRNKVKLGCGFLVAFNWPGNADGPTLSTVDSEDGGVEHEPPRRMANEMTPEMVQQEEEMIRLLHFQKNDTKAIHKTVERDGLILGPRGKQQIRTMRARFGQEQSKALGGANNAQELLLRLQLEGCWMRFTLDDKGRINRVAWALEAQRTTALRYYPLIIQDNTFNTNKYKHHLALIVVVDKENYTHIAMQTLLANERSEDFEFLFRVFRELIGGAQPQKESPWSRHKLCLFHMDENVRKHGKGLGEGVLAGVIRMFHKAAFAPTKELFLQAKQDLFNLLTPGSHMYTYMTESVFGPKWVHRWAKYGHPGLPTLGITSTQRVESTNSALKPAMSRSGTLVDVHRAISKKVKEDANKTTSQNTGGPVQRVRIPTQSAWEVTTTEWLQHFDFVQDGMRQAKCSAFSMKDMSDEALAAMGYTAKTLATGNNDVQRLLADFMANPAGVGLLYGAGEGGDVTLTTGTSITFFAELLREQVADRLVRVTNMYGSQTQYCHLVVLGPDGFFLCTCLRILTDGLGCRHALRAMKDGDVGFTGASIANRWRDSTEEWTMVRLAAKPAVVATAGAGVPGELPASPADPSVFAHSKATVRASGWASCCAFGKELASITAGIDNIPGISRVLENLKNHARLMVEVELRSQHDTSTTRVFKGVVTTPAMATEAPEETRPGGRSGRGESGGAGRGGANGRGRRGAAGRGGRGGAGAVVSAPGVRSPGGGLPTLLQAAGASATSEGGGGGGAGVSAVGMQSPGVGLPASTISGGGGGGAAGVSAVGMQSPGVRLPASTISGGGGGGGAGVSAVGMQSPGVGLPASTVSVRGAGGGPGISTVGMQCLGVGLPASTISGGGGGRGRWCVCRGHAKPWRGASG